MEIEQSNVTAIELLEERERGDRKPNWRQPNLNVICIIYSDWVPLFKVSHGRSVSPAKGVYDLWTGSYTLNENNCNAMTYEAYTNTYKSRIVDNWMKYPIKQVKHGKICKFITIKCAI